jgi:hypothetical protein
MNICNINLPKYVKGNLFRHSDDKIFFYDEQHSLYANPGKRKTDDTQNTIFEHLNVQTSKATIVPETLGKMYFTKSANVPRYKVREIKDKYGLSIIRDFRKADTIVISKDEINTNLDHSWGVYLFERKDVREFLVSLASPRLFIDQVRLSTHVKELIMKKELVDESIQVLDNMPADIDYISFTYGDKEIFEEITKKQGISVGVLSNTSVIECDVLDNLISFKGKNIVTDSCLQSILGSSDMEHENYVFIDQLLSSSDPGNIELGLTLMANCNFEGSQHYLLILLDSYYGQHRYVKYTHSVAFKSLLDFMNFSRYTNVTLDTILDKADSIGKLTDDILQFAHKRAVDEIEKSTRRYKWIKITGITIQKPEQEDDKDQGGD